MNKFINKLYQHKCSIYFWYNSKKNNSSLYKHNNNFLNKKYNKIPINNLLIGLSCVNVYLIFNIK